MYPSTLKLTAAALTPLAALLGTRVQAGQIDLSTLAGTLGVSGNVRDVERIEGGEVFQVTSFAQNGKSAVSHRPALPRFQGTQAYNPRTRRVTYRETGSRDNVRFFTVFDRDGCGEHTEVRASAGTDLKPGDLRVACDEQERVVYREQLPDGATVPTVTPLQWSEDSKVVTVITTDSQGTHTFKDTLNETRPGFERITTTDARGTWVRTIDTAHTNAQGNWLTRQTVHTPDPRCGPAQQAEPCTEWTVVKTRRISYWTAPQPGGP